MTREHRESQVGGRAESSGADDDARVRELLEEAVGSNRLPEDVCAERPELLHAVRRRWEHARAVEARLDALFPSSRGAGGARDAADADREPRRDVAAELPRIPGYAVEAVLGRGGMGVAYRARRVASDRHDGAPTIEDGAVVAVKVVHPHLRHAPGFLERFGREVQIGRTVVHENVVRTLDAGRAATPGDEHVYLVMEHVEGQTLRALLTELGRVPEQLCRHVGREVAKGLSAVHAAGAVHRDLKPENVLITKDHVVKLMDLGVAKALGAGDDLSHPGAFVGSIRYAAPEQLRAGSALDGRTDLYALGVTLYELATGKHPVGGDDFASIARAVLDESPARAGDVTPQLSPFFEEFVAHLMRKDRDARPSSADEVVRILGDGEASDWWRARSAVLRARELGAPRRARIPRETGIHGRQAEMARLSGFLDRAVSGEGQVVLVEGEAGIGKSRLVEEFLASVRNAERDVSILHGGYAPGGAATPGSAFAAALCEHFGEDNLDAALAAHLPHSSALVPAFAAFLRDGPSPAQPEPITQESVQTLFVRTVQALSRRRPVILVVEDLHFAPGCGPAIFASIAHGLADHRILLVGTTRPTVDARWAANVSRLPQTSRLAVGGLALDDVTALLADALRSHRAAAELAATVAAWTCGNPYFVFETLQDLRAHGLLVRGGDGSWTTAPGAQLPRVAPSIRRHVEERIAALTPDEREVLQVAACCGFEFDPALVGRALRLGPLPLFRILSNLESAHRLVHAAGRHHVFDHHHVHETVTAGLSDAHRESIHAAIAEELERGLRDEVRGSADPGGAPAVHIASHFLRSGAGGRALPYLAPAIGHLMSRHEYEPAIDICRRALAIPGLLEGGARFTMVTARARCAEVLGRAAEHLAALEEATALADAGGDKAARAQAHWDLGHGLTRFSRYEEAETALTRAIALFREIGNVSGETGATGHLAMVCTRTGRTALALELNERCIDVATAHGNLHGEEMGRTSLAIALHALGRFGDALVQHERSLAISRELRDRRAEARTLSNLANVLHSMGRYADALSHHTTSREIAAELGDRGGEARSAINVGGLLFALGRHDDARLQVLRGRDLAREIGSAFGEAIATSAMAYGLADQSRFDEARPLFEESAALANRIGSRHVEADALAGLGAALVELSLTDRAIECLDRAAAIAREVDFPTVLVVALAERARLRRDVDRDGDVDGDGARRSADDARAALVEVGGATAASERMRAHWLLWRAEHDPRDLAAARAILDDLLAHAPADCRESMRTNVALHRDVLAASA